MSPTPVSDRPLEMWMKIVGLVALFTFPLIGALGAVAVHELAQINTSLSKINDFIITATGNDAMHSGKIMRLENDVIRIENDVSTISDRVIILERRLP